jgi:hypothetical protein
MALKKFKCSMCQDTECILEFTSKDINTIPNRCPHWLGVARWEIITFDRLFELADEFDKIGKEMGDPQFYYCADRLRKLIKEKKC